MVHEDHLRTASVPHNELCRDITVSHIAEDATYPMSAPAVTTPTRQREVKNCFVCDVHRHFIFKMSMAMSHRPRKTYATTHPRSLYPALHVCGVNSLFIQINIYAGHVPLHSMRNNLLAFSCRLEPATSDMSDLVTNIKECTRNTANQGKIIIIINRLQ